MSQLSTIVNDITKMNPVEVGQIVTPASVEEIVEAVTSTSGQISIGGGRFSMGGQTVSGGSLHLDMRQFKKIIDFSKEDKTIVNANAIRFYEKYGFTTVSESGSQELHEEYGLPPLIRMAHKL